MCDFFAFGVGLYHIGTNIGVWHTIQPTVQAVHLTDLIELGACRNMVIDHQKMEFFILSALVDGGEQHAAGVDAHHGPRRQVGDGDEGLADQLLRLVECMDAGKDDTVRAGAVIQRELQQLLGLGHGLAGLDLDRAEIRLGEGIKINEFLKKRLDHHVGEVDLLLRGLGCLGGVIGLVLGLSLALHRRDFISNSRKLL